MKRSGNRFNLHFFASSARSTSLFLPEILLEIKIDNKEVEQNDKVDINT